MSDHDWVYCNRCGQDFRLSAGECVADVVECKPDALDLINSLRQVIGMNFGISTLANGRILLDIWDDENYCVMISGAGNYWRVECHYFTPSRFTEGVMSLTEALEKGKRWLAERR